MTREKHLAQPCVTGAALRLSHHEDIADQCPLDEQSCGADQNHLANLFRVARRKFCGNPPADAAADEVELRKVQCIQKLQIVKDHIFDGFDIFIFVTLRASWMRRRNDPSACSEALVKRQPAFFDGVDIDEAVQVEQRSATAVLQEPNLALFKIQKAAAHKCASFGCSMLTPGYSRSKNGNECSRRRGATCSANKVMLLSASSLDMLPI